MLSCSLFGMRDRGVYANGWDFGDALYMVVLTVYTVGYDEVKPIDSAGIARRSPSR